MKNEGMDQLIEYAIESAKERKYCTKGEMAVLIQGFFKGNPDLEYYILKIMKIN